MPKVVLTIGGSDSGGGAGIQADLKTFSILGLHGTCALTAVTAQNTMGVRRVFGLGPEAVASQLTSITDDFSVAFAKTGMLFSAEIVNIVAEHLKRKRIAFVLDPVIEAEAGGRLLRPSAVKSVQEHLIPLAWVVTPNIFEAEALTGVRVKDLEGAELAAQKLIDLGAKAVIVKGGHLDCTDLLREEGDVHQLQGRRVAGGNHGVGCTYSAALTSFLAYGHSLLDSARKAKEFAALAVAHSMDVGHGAGPVNQAATKLEEAARFRLLCDVQEAVDRLLSEPTFFTLIPEAGSNIGAAIAGAAEEQDIAAIDGCLIRSENRVHQTGCSKFGAGGHLCRIILTAMRFDPFARAAMNMNIDALPACNALGLTTAHIDLLSAPAEWERMLRSRGPPPRNAAQLPDAVWEKGERGKEPMLVILGEQAAEVAEVAVRISRCLSDGKI
jgi:hydroxymethylpyrimidine kinase / phosphomethylpyrimidine kinase / thiamine-phosphate diphosphorylase